MSEFSRKVTVTLHARIGNVASILRSAGKYDFGTRAFVVALRFDKFAADSSFAPEGYTGNHGREYCRNFRARKLARIKRAY